MKRFSIIQEDMSRCYICDKPKQHIHEVFYGINRNNSIKYGLVVGLCLDHHTGYNGVHTIRGSEYNKKLKEIAQNKFMEHYNKTEKDFIKIFGKNYLK